MCKYLHDFRKEEEKKLFSLCFFCTVCHCTKTILNKSWCWYISMENLWKRKKKQNLHEIKFITFGGDRKNSIYVTHLKKKTRKKSFVSTYPQNDLCDCCSKSFRIYMIEIHLCDFISMCIFYLVSFTCFHNSLHHFFIFTSSSSI